MEVVEDVVIVGAGIAGLATAVALTRVGVKALVLERSDGLRATGAALILSRNAWLALDALGVSHKLNFMYPFIKEAYITNLESGAIQEISAARRASGNGGTRSRAVHRKALLETLAGELPTNSIRFSSKLTEIETESHLSSSIAVVHLEDRTVIKAKVLIGCDGVHSMVASSLGIAAPIHSGRSAVRGLAVFPQGHCLKDEMHQFIGTGRRAGLVPVNDKEIYWFFTCASPDKDLLSGDPRVIQREVIEKYAKDFPELYLDVVKHTDLSTLTWAPLMFRYPWNVAFGNLSKQNITVAGDAMHPMTPDLGQGGCAALEDAVVLGRHIATSILQNGGLDHAKMVETLANYIEERRWRATWLITWSYLTGWVQEGGSLWGLKFVRDAIFYGLIFKNIGSLMEYDCGKLPIFPFLEESD
ncbi:monooxygenase 2-like [Humulus lupulus]|uniref:monooxygenase 2-like n=1 Tax=Humulus lupulus TaxID=3486 RepID=UPI002B402C89|nr:monooxygenase 2-like [Humulus lupulus]